MGRSPCCSKEGMNRGAWTSFEDKILTDHIQINGQGRWRELPKKAGLNRCGKSCRLRWLNYLRPDIKRGNFTEDEDELIIKLHKLLGNRWSLIAGRLPARTDNEIKNYWNTNLGKRTQGSSTATSSDQQNLSHSRKKKHLKEPSDETVTSQNVEPVKAVRTKAHRCTKAFVTPQPEKEKHLDERLNQDVDTNRPFSPIEEKYRPSFLQDIDVGDLSLTDLVDSHLYQLGYFDKDTKEFAGSYKNISSNELSLCADWRESGSSSGFHSFSFLDPEEGWLRD